MIVPLDHSVADGPLDVESSLDELVGELAGAEVDAVVLHKGTVRHVAPDRFGRMSLVVHLSASTAHAPDPDAKYLVASVESAVRLGADAVSVHVNLGSEQEGTQIGDLARVAESCDAWNVPLLAMVYARGRAIERPTDPDLVAHAAGLAADLGADVVKVADPDDEAALADIVAGCPIPVVVAGGAPGGDTASLLRSTAGLMRAGAAGVAMGRKIFQAAEPGATARRVADVVHHAPRVATTPVISPAV